jgi:hypothetical protein
MKLNFGAVDFGNVSWIELNHDGILWWAFVVMMRNLQIL